MYVSVSPLTRTRNFTYTQSTLTRVSLEEQRKTNQIFLVVFVVVVVVTSRIFLDIDIYDRANGLKTGFQTLTFVNLLLLLSFFLVLLHEKKLANWQLALIKVYIYICFDDHADDGLREERNEEIWEEKCK